MLVQASKGHLGAMQKLLENGADPNGQDCTGSTALHRYTLLFIRYGSENALSEPCELGMLRSTNLSRILFADVLPGCKPHLDRSSVSVGIEPWKQIARIFCGVFMYPASLDT